MTERPEEVIELGQVPLRRYRTGTGLVWRLVRPVRHSGR